MKKVLLMPALAIVLFAGACSEDEPTTVIPTPTVSVRFFNATPGITGGFTTNGQFAAGSALAFAQSTCTKVNAGSTSFGFGAANTGGTGLSGSALATLNNQSITEGGNFTVAATGSATSPTLYLIDNSFSGTLGSNQAAVRFVNLAPGTITNPNNLAVFRGEFGNGGTLIINNPDVGSPSQFEIVTSGSNTFSLLRNHELPAAIPQMTFNLQGGGVYTIAIITNGLGGFDLIPHPRCA